MLNMHFHGVFRQIKPDGDQLVGQSEIERGEHLLLTGRQVGHRPLAHDRRGIVSIAAIPLAAVLDNSLRKAVMIRRCLEVGSLILSNDGQRPVGASGKDEAQSGDGDLDGDRAWKKAADTPLHRGRSGGLVVAV